MKKTNSNAALKGVFMASETKPELKNQSKEHIKKVQPAKVTGKPVGTTGLECRPVGN